MSATVHQTGATCPSCGRFVGPLEKCPFCGADVKKRLPLKYLRLAALVLAILGMAILLYAVSGMATPMVKIGRVGATMNYAYVRLEGTVTGGPLYDPDEQTLRFYIGDETGEILALSFRATTRQLIEQNKIPRVGDKISVEGTLRVRDDLTSFNLASADKLALAHSQAQALAIAEIGQDDEFRAIIIRGDVREIRKPYEGLTLVTVGDATGEVDVAITADVEKLYGPVPELNLGDSVEVQGAVTFFRDTPQLLLAHPQELRKLALNEAPATTLTLAQVDASRVGERVNVQGQVMRVGKFSQGVRVTLDDGSGQITVVLWQDLLDEIPNADALKKGAQMQVLGKVSQYRGELEIIPTRASDVAIVTVVAQAETKPIASPSRPSDATAQATQTITSSVSPTLLPTATQTRTPASVAPERSIGSVSIADKGKRVVVNGEITHASAFSRGMRYLLDDGTGKITLLIWSEVLEQIPFRAALIQGARVRVTGKVDVFNDTLEVIPDRAEEVELVATSALPTAAPRIIASITVEDIDKVVLLRGHIVELADFSSGKYITVQDDSGKIRVTVFSNVLKPIAERLQVGAQIAVRGRVNVFRGQLEVIADEISF